MALINDASGAERAKKKRKPDQTHFFSRRRLEDAVSPTDDHLSGSSSLANSRSFVKIVPPSSRMPECMYSLVLHTRAPFISRAVKDARSQSTNASSTYDAHATGTAFLLSTSAQYNAGQSVFSLNFCATPFSGRNRANSSNINGNTISPVKYIFAESFFSSEDSSPDERVSAFSGSNSPSFAALYATKARSAAHALLTPAPLQ
mmetsp:Transcript_12939/g.54289  ORF Transcript_12939/g.54289 Transcript_12939/m.54289 type:complete len:203 (+) Transcript_12939:2375-2983(+)